MSGLRPALSIAAGYLFEMFRPWRRLVACVNVVAFLLANTHVGFALDALLQVQATATGQTSESRPSPEGSAGENARTTKCCHCAKRERPPVEEPSQAPAEDKDRSHE